MDSTETVSETIREAILAILKSASTPLTAAELRVRLRVRALRLAEYEILHALRCLRAEGSVRLERGRWMLLHLLPKGYTPPPWSDGHRNHGWRLHLGERIAQLRTRQDVLLPMLPAQEILP